MFGFEPGAVFQLKGVFGKLHWPFQLIPSLLKGTARRERAKRGNNGKWWETRENMRHFKSAFGFASRECAGDGRGAWEWQVKTPLKRFNIEIEYWLEQHKWQITVTGKSIFFFVINAGHLFPIYSAALLPFCRNSPCRLLFAKGGRKRGFLSFNGANHVLKAQNVPKDNLNFFLRRNPPTDFCDLSFIFLRFLFCFELAGGKRFPKHCRLLT